MLAPHLLIPCPSLQVLWILSSKFVFSVFHPLCPYCYCLCSGLIFSCSTILTDSNHLPASIPPASSPVSTQRQSDLF